MLWLELFGYLIVILIAAEVFVNALEHLGEKLKISEGVTGSIFAAVGTALPETMVPLLAIFAGTQNAQINEEIGHFGRAAHAVHTDAISGQPGGA
jgi:cation:H+ antiporter